MLVKIYDSHDSLARASAEFAAQQLKAALLVRENVTVVAGTGAAHIRFLDALCRVAGVPWDRVVLFHLDEYIGLPEDHPADFHAFLRQHLIDRVHPGKVHLIDGRANDPEAERRRYGALLAAREVDLCFLGIGENCHLAFNDPPADFTCPDPYLILEIDQASRRQQAGEGWFKSPEEVPGRAITISMQQILKSHCNLVVVPETRKANAVRDALEREIDPRWPATILRRHPNTHLLLDRDSASLLTRHPKQGERWPVEFEV